MKKRNGRIWCAALMAMALLAGCGKSESAYPAMNSDTGGASADYYYDDVAYGEGGYDYDESYAATNGMSGITMTESVVAEEQAGSARGDAKTDNTQDAGRKLIRNISMDVETTEFESLVAQVKSRTNALGGYVENSYEYNGSSYYSGQQRNASLTLRIPASQVDLFITDVAEISNITSQSERVEDVTLNYVDIESHRNALRAEQERLLEMLELTETIEEMIYIQDNLTSIRYQLESMESQLRTYDNQVDYATVNIYVTEVLVLTPVEPEQEPTTWEKISTGFMESLYAVGRGIRGFFIGFIVALPYLVVWAAIILVVFLILRAILRGWKRRRQRRQEKLQAKQGQPTEPQQVQAKEEPQPQGQS